MTSEVMPAVHRLSNGAMMPVLGLGTFGIRDAAVIERAIVEIGFRHIDTAPIYGN